jgi:uncharacterized damage-inducible protein DinB
MDTIPLLQRLHQHRAWVNRKLLDAAEQLSGEQLLAQFAIGQGSVWKSLTHLCAAEHVWLETLKGDEQALFPGDLPGKLPGNQQGEGRIADLADLRQRWAALNARWVAYLASLKPEALEESVYRTRTKDGATMRLSVRRSDALLHVCTHSHYTATQVINMFRQNGVAKLPEIMLLTMAREETAS